MEFRLIFEGDVRPRQGAKLADVHAIRRAIRPQIEELWKYPPLSYVPKIARPATEQEPYALHEERGGVMFAPLVSDRLNLLAELDILFLRHQPPGKLIGAGGDIDNRVKTLLDALRMPGADQIAQLGDVFAEASPFHVLLQDDSLVTKLNVETDRLLREPSQPQAVVAIIKVKVRVTRVTFESAMLLS